MKYFTLKEASEKIGIDKSNLYKYIKDDKYGKIGLSYQRKPETQNQKTQVISNRDLQKIQKIRKEQGYNSPKPIKNSKIGKDDDEGYIYFCQTNPKHIPKRFKIGFTTSLNKRLQTYKTVCPNAKYIFKIECKQIYERPILEMIARRNKQIGTELFVIDNVEKEIENTKKVFELLLGKED